jgi:Mg-chelatase subunit ChlD
VTFHLRYEELLQRSENGKYSHVVYVQPQGRIIECFKLNVQIKDSSPLEEISVMYSKNKDEAKSEALDITQYSILKQKETFAEIGSRAIDKKHDRKFFINYDVKRPKDGNRIQVKDEQFVHCFAPDNRPTMAKHIIFVIDVSGSMQGKKLEQTQDAMNEIFIMMSKANRDNFNIITFNSDVEIWKPSVNGLSYSIPKANGNINDAYDYVLNLEADGTTNINNALLKALNLASEVRRNEEIEYFNTQQMIVFLTDGKPTANETSAEKIIANIANIQEKNSGRYMVPIYGLAFGQDADFNLLKNISDKNGGFVQRIYESGNSYEQLEDFYNQISSKNQLSILSI